MLDDDAAQPAAEATDLCTVEAWALEARVSVAAVNHLVSLHSIPPGALKSPAEWAALHDATTHARA